MNAELLNLLRSYYLLTGRIGVTVDYPNYTRAAAPRLCTSVFPDKAEIIRQKAKIKNLTEGMHTLPRKLKNKRLREISIAEQRLRQTQYNHKHKLGQTITIES